MIDLARKDEYVKQMKNGVLIYIAQHGLYTALAKPRLAFGKFSSALRRVRITFSANQAIA